MVKWVLSKFKNISGLTVSIPDMLGIEKTNIFPLNMVERVIEILQNSHGYLISWHKNDNYFYVE